MLNIRLAILLNNYKHCRTIYKVAATITLILCVYFLYFCESLSGLYLIGAAMFFFVKYFRFLYRGLDFNISGSLSKLAIDQSSKESVLYYTHRFFPSRVYKTVRKRILEY